MHTSHLPLSELRLVRRALHILYPSDRLSRRRYRPIDDLLSPYASKRAGPSRNMDDHRRRPSKGFGFGGQSSELPESPNRQFEEDAQGGEEDSYVSRPEYQIYADPLYKPKRFIGNVDIAPLQGGGQGGGRMVFMMAHIPIPHVVGLPSRHAPNHARLSHQAARDPAACCL